MNDAQKFADEIQSDIIKYAKDINFQQLGKQWHDQIAKNKYAYRFKWLGRPIIQEPQDIVMMQQLIWEIKPTLIIETGIAHGGSIIFSASMLALLDMCTKEYQKIQRQVVGIDIDIRKHNREEIENHGLYKKNYMVMIEGSSIAPQVITQVKEIANHHEKILIFLDSCHTHEHVLAELNAYAPLVSKNSYCVVWDTGIEDLPEGTYPDKPWGKGNNPKTAVREYLKDHAEFIIDENIEDLLIITAASDGWLRRME